MTLIITSKNEMLFGFTDGVKLTLDALYNYLSQANYNRHQEIYELFEKIKLDLSNIKETPEGLLNESFLEIGDYLNDMEIILQFSEDIEEVALSFVQGMANIFIRLNLKNIEIDAKETIKNDIMGYL